MSRIKLSLAAALIAAGFTSCSQTPGISSAGIFTATTPCYDVSKKLLHIPPDTKCAMMRWRLELNQDAKTFIPSGYKLVVTYGMDKQASRDFSPGAQTIELNGKWKVENGLEIQGSGGTVYTLTADNAPITLSFLKTDTNLLHLLDADRHLVVGGGAWSYTLNRVNPVPSPSVKKPAKTTSIPPLKSDSSVVGVFDGRTPCNLDLLALNGISANGCQIIKCRLTLYQDVTTHTPTTFQMYTVHVGKGDNRYSTTGKWTVSKGTATDPDAIVYQLQPDSGKPQSISFVKADDNILFMLDEKKNLLVGNEYVSFTLNKQLN